MAVIGTLLCVASLVAFSYSLAERELRAALFSLLFALVLPALYIIPLFLPGETIATYPIVLLSLTIVLFLLFLYNPKPKKFAPGKPNIRHDERETMFSRRELAPNSTTFENYYKQNPEHKKPDDNWRKKPGLMNPGAIFYHGLAFNAAEASFETIGKLGQYINGEVKKEKTATSPEKLTVFIKKWMLKQGLKDIGITKMKPYHYYHTKGRGIKYGKSITPKYKYGIAFTVEMDEQMMAAAPKGSAIMESADQYLKSGVPAIQLATFLRESGYEAQAHIDGNYEVVCPLVARDAGLGEIGRMGLLMTPKQGPRVRIAVVTTNAPLEIDKPSKIAHSMIEFCHYCKKCAFVCPSQSIPTNERSMIDGAIHWKIDSESCFTYWCTAGTDCGRCMAVCPYAHPDNPLHNFVRFGIRHSKLFRRLAVYLDDLFYGKKPRIKPLPRWMQ